MITALVALEVGAFFLGSIPVGVLAARSQGVDILAVGSKNMGATNVYRTLGPKVGVPVFLLDVMKGLIPVLIARGLVTSGAPNGVDAQVVWFLAGMAAFFGHMFSPFVGFKGGKGVATGLGMLLATAPLVALASLSAFVIVVWISGWISLGSIVAAIVLPFAGWFIPGESRQLVPLYMVLSAFVIFKHRGNIKRIMDRSEPKFRG